MSQEVFLEFKYLKNRIMDLGNGEQYPIPYKMEPSSILGHKTAIAAYNLDKIHRVRLLSEKPQMPEREQGMSDRLYSELCDEAFRNAMENRQKNQALRKRIEAFVKSGTIEVTNDPFVVKTHTEGEKPTTAAPEPESEHSQDETHDDEAADETQSVPTPPKRGQNKSK
jgi:hypothetical protein